MTLMSILGLNNLKNFIGGRRRKTRKRRKSRRKRGGTPPVPLKRQNAHGEGQGPFANLNPPRGSVYSPRSCC